MEGGGGAGYSNQVPGKINIFPQALVWLKRISSHQALRLVIHSIINHNFISSPNIKEGGPSYEIYHHRSLSQVVYCTHYKVTCFPAFSVTNTRTRRWIHVHVIISWLCPLIAVRVNCDRGDNHCVLWVTKMHKCWQRAYLILKLCSLNWWTLRVYTDFMTILAVLWRVLIYKLKYYVYIQKLNTIFVYKCF